MHAASSSSVAHLLHANIMLGEGLDLTPSLLLTQHSSHCKLFLDGAFVWFNCAGFILAPAMSLLPDILIMAYQRTFYPSTAQLLQVCEGSAANLRVTLNTGLFQRGV